jgi:excisionase family DNA binding protein
MLPKQLLPALPFSLPVHIRKLRHPSSPRVPERFSICLKPGYVGHMTTEENHDEAIPSPVMTADELSAYLRINRRTLNRLLKKHPIPSFRVGSNHRFDRQAIDDWVRAQELQLALPAQELEATLPMSPFRRGRRPRVGISRSSS